MDQKSMFQTTYQLIQNPEQFTESQLITLIIVLMQNKDIASLGLLFDRYLSTSSATTFKYNFTKNLTSEYQEVRFFLALEKLLEEPNLGTIARYLNSMVNWIRMFPPPATDLGLSQFIDNHCTKVETALKSRYVGVIEA